MNPLVLKSSGSWSEMKITFWQGNIHSGKGKSLNIFVHLEQKLHEYPGNIGKNKAITCIDLRSSTVSCQVTCLTQKNNDFFSNCTNIVNKNQAWSKFLNYCNVQIILGSFAALYHK